MGWNLILPEKAIKLLTQILKMPENNLEPLPHRSEKLKNPRLKTDVPVVRDNIMKILVNILGVYQH